jgi:hypothetical protein
LRDRLGNYLGSGKIARERNFYDLVRL